MVPTAAPRLASGSSPRSAARNPRHRLAAAIGGLRCLVCRNSRQPVAGAASWSSSAGRSPPPPRPARHGVALPQSTPRPSAHRQPRHRSPGPPTTLPLPTQGQTDPDHARTKGFAPWFVPRCQPQTEPRQRRPARHCRPRPPHGARPGPARHRAGAHPSPPRRRAEPPTDGDRPPQAGGFFRAEDRWRVMTPLCLVSFEIG